MKSLALLPAVLAAAAAFGLVTGSGPRQNSKTGAIDVAALTSAESQRHTTGSSAADANDTIDDPVAEVTACFRTCDDAQLSAEDRPTCVLRCVSDLEPDLDDCEQPCLEKYARCWNPCASARPRTDAFTCRLNCEQVAEQCVGACRDVDASS